MCRRSQSTMSAGDRLPFRPRYMGALLPGRPSLRAAQLFYYSTTAYFPLQGESVRSRAPVYAPRRFPVKKFPAQPAPRGERAAPGLFCALQAVEATDSFAHGVDVFCWRDVEEIVAGGQDMLAAHPLRCLQDRVLRSRISAGEAVSSRSRPRLPRVQMALSSWKRRPPGS